jgi:hypothetical protein
MGRQREATPGRKPKSWKSERNLADVFTACREQGFSVERTHHHIRIVPPNPEMNIVVHSATSGDWNARTLFIAELKRNGFIWPWPAEQQDEVKPPELWVPVLRCSAYEFSSQDRVRNKMTLREVTANERGHFVLTDDKGKLRHFSLERMHELAEFAPPEKETPMMTDTVDEPAGDVRREIVLTEGVVEGYEVDELANVFSPHGKKLTSKVWGPNSTSVYVTLQLHSTADRKYIQKRFPLDEIVLEAFEARPDAHWIPQHVDGDFTNCTLVNLRWVQGSKKETPVDIPPDVIDRVTAPTPTEFLEAVVEKSGVGLMAKEVADAARRQREVDELKEADDVAAAEQHHLDYPSASRREGVTQPSAAALQDIERGYPEDHMRQDEELTREWSILGDDAKALLVGHTLGFKPPQQIRIVSSHVYTDEVSGLSVSVSNDGNILTPGITLENLRVVQALLSAARE